MYNYWACAGPAPGPPRAHLGPTSGPPRAHQGFFCIIWFFELHSCLWCIIFCLTGTVCHKQYGYSYKVVSCMRKLIQKAGSNFQNSTHHSKMFVSGPDHGFFELHSCLWGIIFCLTGTAYRKQDGYSYTVVSCMRKLIQKADSNSPKFHPPLPNVRFRARSCGFLSFTVVFGV